MALCRHCGKVIEARVDGSRPSYCLSCNPYSVSFGKDQIRYLNLWKADENGIMKPGRVDANGDFIFLEDDERMSGKTVAELLDLPAEENEKLEETFSEGEE